MKNSTIDNKNKPLKIIHGRYGYDPSVPLEEKIRMADKCIDFIEACGYGGLVANVGDDKYLESSDEWTVSDYVSHECARRGLRYWVYDEKGYPSGSAGGLTLRNHREYESKALAGVFIKIKKGEKVDMPLPKGHLKAIAASAYDGDTLETIDFATRIDLTPLIKTDGSLCWTSDRDGLLAYFVTKPFYERTHAMHNVNSARRAIDVSDERAVGEFIQNTYVQYVTKQGDLIGKNFEAFFTDEPSYMGFYMAASDTKVSINIQDKFDRTMPFYPCLNWGHNFLEKFESIKGYNLTPYLVYLFGGMSKKAVKVRTDYYDVLNIAYERSYFAQIGDFCRQRGVGFSGHILAEDNIVKHIYFEGDLFRLLKHMDIPGIDMLTAMPEKFMNWPKTNFRYSGEDEVINWATGPKLVSSIARLYGKSQVMSEVSAHMEGGKDVSIEQEICTALLQYATGVNVFTSYFSFDESDGCRYCETVAHTDEKLGNSEYLASVAMYYPIRQMQGYALPQECTASNAIVEADKIMNATAYTYSYANRALLTAQTGFDMIGLDELSAAETDGKGGFGFGNRAYKVLLVPACPIDEQLYAQLKRLSNEGVRIIAITHEVTAALADFSDVKVEKVPCEAGAITEAINAIVSPDAICSNRDVVLSAYRADDGAVSYLMVNYQDREMNCDVQLPTTGYAIYRPDGDKQEPFRGSVNFAPYEAVILVKVAENAANCS